ncbi:SBBP repeat-containing protein [Mechercharimyces sp. CAU 1602]|uniref:DUF7948 domain-containing protein n=1 Tax=Mechercharimyces sp. CAU 1602 TaxID=2973933 RepID=UPI0021619FDF|nr:SBBP repeat-containing protein [Mechercharimyces sp. CAU 1602]MCS1351337.1 SBBP repeat-containing protein [Mechercharimyces sp. CAU 1602]
MHQIDLRPMVFVPGDRRTKTEFLYQGEGEGCSFFFYRDRVDFQFSTDEKDASLSLQFIDAYPQVDMELDSLENKVIYREVWKGIDIIFSGTNEQLKYDVMVYAGAEVDNIRLRYEGSDAITLNEHGDLLIQTSCGVLREEKPISFQWVHGEKRSISTAFRLFDDSSIGFSLTSYNVTLPLLIDPVVFYSTYIGGNDFDRARGIAVNAKGEAYIKGITNSANFPITTGAFKTILVGDFDAFITRLNATGTSLIYSTYLGGSSSEFSSIVVGGIAVDSRDQAFVTGSTTSTDFPVTSGAFQTLFGGGTDAFVTRLNATGSSLLYSTYLGGSSVDSGFDIAINENGNAYVIGGTVSTDFPITGGAFQTIFRGNVEVFVTQLSPAGSSLIYSTFLGGDRDDVGLGITLDKLTNAYVTGQTDSTNFPTTNGAFQTMLGGLNDAFVTKINAAGNDLIYSTYLGGSQDDNGVGIALDGATNAYVTGFTRSTNFPILPDSFQTVFGGGEIDAFVTKINEEGSSLVYSTFLGGDALDASFRIAVDAFGSAWVIGETFSSNFPITSDAFQNRLDGPSDAFITQLSFSGRGISFSSFLGGSDDERGFGVALDAIGSTYLTGETFSSNFPVTFQAFQKQFGGNADAFVMKLGQLTGAIGATGPQGPRGQRGARGPRGVEGGESGL